jgi:dTDP-4-dehydrorhamnose 3,5-epimerase
MNIIRTQLHGVIVIEPRVFGDARGFFYESWNQERYLSFGVSERFVQDNLSFSTRGVLRGLHFQNPQAQGKLVSALKGEVFDVVADVRPESPTFGRWVGVYLSAENKRQMYVPPGYAHGFQVTSDEALFTYKCTEYYRPDAEHTIAWNDPDLAVSWPIKEPVLSPKDRKGISLADWASECSSVPGR